MRLRRWPVKRSVSKTDVILSNAEGSIVTSYPTLSLGAPERIGDAAGRSRGHSRSSEGHDG